MTGVRESERGAALLSVLLMVAVLSVIAATTLDRLNLSGKLAVNGNTLAQARMFSYAAENIAAARLEDLVMRDAAQTTLEGGWLGAAQRLPIPVGSASATVRDGGNCFNLNSLVTEGEGALQANPAGQQQFIALMLALGIDLYAADGIAAAAVDWADSDQAPVQNGAEDEVYRSAKTPYLTANRLFAHPSELRAVRGVTPDIYAKLGSWICALPEAVLSPLNVNTLLPEQAPLLSMLLPPGSLPVQNARAVLAKRPASGYGSLIRFWAAPELAAAQPSSLVQGQVKLTSKYFLLDGQVSSGDLLLESRSFIVVDQGQSRILWRSWGEQA